MKIGVLTFHRCINYGSYWQARCLVEGLRGLGHDAQLMDHQSDAVRRAELRCAFQPQLPTRTPRSKLSAYATKTRHFLDAFERLPRSEQFALDRPEEAGAYDAVLVGSDEVWNFRHPWYAFKPIFFGERLQAGRLISYAASFGNHDAEDGIDPQWAAKLKRFDCLSVRDENSRQLVRRHTGREPELVLDPCLQFPPPPPAISGSGSATLVVYGHGFPDWFVTRLRRWADTNGCRIVSIGYHAAFADEQRIEATPEEFSALMAGATAVATNFFHGCVFALHYGRPFVCAPSSYRFNKVRDLTSALGAEGHVVTEATTAAGFAERLGEPLDPGIGLRIAAMRARSSAYLQAALG